jgi:hypothetical protein
VTRPALRDSDTHPAPAAVARRNAKCIDIAEFAYMM